MEKKFYYSVTFWGSILLGVSVALENMGTEFAIYGKGLGSALAVFGIRRAMK